MGLLGVLAAACLIAPAAEARRPRRPRPIPPPTAAGKIDGALAAHVRALAPTDPVPVIIWAMPRATPPEYETTEADRTQRAQRAKREAKTRFLADAHAADVAPLAAALRRRGYQVKLEGRLCPLLAAEVPAGALDEIAARAEVDAIYLSESGGPELFVKAQAEFAPPVWARGITGAGAVAAIVEAGAVAPDNPFLSVGQFFDPGDLDVLAHTTAVAGVIQSTDATERGIAFGAAPLISANAGSFADVDLIAATEWAVLDASPPADVINYSFFVGSTESRFFTPLDRYADHLVRDHRKLVVKSAGNQGLASGNVTSPGKGWNVLAVGAFDDFGTPAIADDAMSVDSSWRDPIAPNGLPIAKPEVVAMGCHDSVDTVRITSTLTDAPWIGAEVGCGTSFAAPSVAATALLAIRRRPKLREWPEALKAIIMASAVHNIEGAERFSSADGAGAIRIVASDNIARASSKVFFRTFNGQTFTTQDVMTYHLGAGQRSRVALVWDSNPSAHAAGGAPAADALETDLDLEVIRAAAGTVVASSHSANNAFELVDFAAPAAGSYTVRVTNAGSTETEANFMGVARWP